MGGDAAGVLIGVPGSAGREVSDMMPGERVRQWRDAATLDSVSH